MERLATTLLLLVFGVATSAQAGDLIRLNQRVFDPATETGAAAATSTAEQIVQFDGAVGETQKGYLREMGFEVLGYLPDDAYVVRGAPSSVPALMNLKGVRAVVAYLPEYKLSSGLPAGSAFVADKPERLVVQAFRDQDAETVVAGLYGLGNVHVFATSGRTLHVIAPIGQRLRIAGLAGVEHVQADPGFHPLVIDLGAQDVPQTQAGLTGDESGTRAMGFDAIWALGYNGRGQTASMADTGLDTGDLTTLFDDFKPAVSKGYTVGLFGKSWEDPMGHGTHVAGSIMGNGAKSNGVIKGGAYGANLVPVSMWSPMLNNLSVPSKLADLFAKAQADGARVHSNSWGAANNLGAYDGFAQQVDEWTFNNPDTLVLFAAGNSGVDKNKDGRIDPNSVCTPGTSKNVLTVGASENVTKTGGIQVPVNRLRTAPESWPVDPINSGFLSDNVNGLAMFSSRGPTNDRRLKPEIVAPGANILSNRSHTKTAEDLWGKYNDDYVWSGGTSMATPLAAGAATVTRQYLIENRGVANPSAVLVKATLLHTATDMFPGQYGEIGAARGQEILTRRPNADEGYGRVDMGNLVSLPPTTQFIDERTGVGAGEEKSWTLQVPANGSILVNLVYSDAPASANAASTLVNDLDLSLTGPDGQRVAPLDRINNNEVIELSGLTGGTFRIAVKGEKVPQGKGGKQPFAVVMTAK